MMPNICVENLDSDNDSENEEVKELEGGLNKKANAKSGLSHYSMSKYFYFNSLL